MRIRLSSIHVDDQARALAFYRDVVGFTLKHDEPVGPYRWITLVSPEDPDGVELCLEPDNHPAAQAYCAALKGDGIPVTAFEVDDLDEEVERLTAAGVTFTAPPTDAGAVRYAVLDDTCGNLVQLYQTL